MPRSLKKGPFVDPHLMEKVQQAQDSRGSRVVKTWSRRSTITPDFVGHTIAVHDADGQSATVTRRPWSVISEVSMMSARSRNSLLARTR